MGIVSLRPFSLEKVPHFWDFSSIWEFSLNRKTFLLFIYLFKIFLQAFIWIFLKFRFLLSIQIFTDQIPWDLIFINHISQINRPFCYLLQSPAWQTLKCWLSYFMPSLYWVFVDLHLKLNIKSTIFSTLIHTLYLDH